MGPAARFRSAVEAGRWEDAVGCLAGDATFHSPIAHRPHHGREAIRPVLLAVSRVFEGFRYTAQYEGPGGAHVLAFAATVGDRALEGVDIIEPDAAGSSIATLTVMVRPLSAATELRDRMAAALAAG